MHLLTRILWLSSGFWALALSACHDAKTVTVHTQPGAAVFSVGGSVTGSSGHLILQCDGLSVAVAGNGNFTCPQSLAAGDTYAVTVLSEPTGQSCEVTAGSGTITDANVQVAVACAQTAFSLTVQVSGLFDDSNVRLNLGTATQVITANGQMTLSLPGQVGEQVHLALAAQPPGLYCVLNLDTLSLSPTPATLGVSCVRNMRIASTSAANMVLGQTDFVTSTAPTTPAALGSFNLPAGRVASDGEQIFVAEFGGNQVSVLTPGASSNLDFRLGVDVSQSNSGRYGPEDLDSPSGVAISGTHLAVASQNGSRVLLYNAIPTAPVSADVVVGQPGFGTAPTVTCSPNQFAMPLDVAFADGKLFVADGGCNRVLIFDPVPTASYAGASLVLGQSDFYSFDPNRGAPNAGAGTLYHPSSVWADANTLFVADAFNNRVLVWLTLPTQIGQPADRVLGQTSMSQVGPGVGVNALSTPYGLVADDSSLFIADAGNNRVLVYALPLPLAGTPVATGVLGQADFASRVRNAPSQVASSGNLYQPTGVGFFNATLLVTDSQDSRVLGWGSN